MPGEHYKHIVLSGTGRAEPYRSRSRGGQARSLPPRQRHEHGTKLRSELETAWIQAETRRAEPQAVGLGTPHGFYLEFRSEPGFELTSESLDFRRSGIELLAVRTSGNVTTATVFVPDEKRSYFLRKIEQYLTGNTAQGAPRNKRLIESISEIRLAVLESFWTDASESFPEPGAQTWWEVWLRREGETPMNQLTDVAQRLNLQIGDRRLEFPERTVVLLFGTPEQLSASTDLLDSLAEVRLARETPAIVTHMPQDQQLQIAADFRDRIETPPPAAPAVCILDTGVTQAHLLIAPGLDVADVHTCEPAWGSNDHHGHGTQMAGLALYGDLAQILLTQGPIPLRTCLESVKILPPVGQNAPELYGALTPIRK